MDNFMPVLLSHGLEAYIASASILSEYFWHVSSVVHIQSENIFVSPFCLVLWLQFSDHEPIVIIN